MKRHAAGYVVFRTLRPAACNGVGSAQRVRGLLQHRGEAVNASNRDMNLNLPAVADSAPQGQDYGRLTRVNQYSFFLMSTPDARILMLSLCQFW